MRLSAILASFLVMTVLWALPAEAAGWNRACLLIEGERYVDVYNSSGSRITQWWTGIEVDINGLHRNGMLVHVRRVDSNVFGYVSRGALYQREACDYFVRPERNHPPVATPTPRPTPRPTPLPTSTPCPDSSEPTHPLDPVNPSQPEPEVSPEPLVPSSGDVGDPFGCEQRGERKQDKETCNRDALLRLAQNGHHSLGYDGARVQMFQYVDAKVDENGRRYVESVYSPDLEFTVGSSGMPRDGVNTEHTFPQTYLKRYPTYSTSKADIHHLFPCEIGINSERGSLPFTECSGGGLEEGRACNVGRDGFEPPDGHKGRVALAVFYVSVRYGIPVDNAQERVLRDWVRRFPPTSDDLERDRRVKEVQGNSNPFVQHPEWTNLISDF